MEAARKWRVPPTVFIRQRTANTTEWTGADTALAMALENYEATLCPGGDHVLAVSSRPDHADAYRPGDRTRCHYCTARARVSDALGKDKQSQGVMVSLALDPDVVIQNQRPVPPLPPELMVAD